MLRKYGLKQHDIVKTSEIISRVQSDRLSVVRKRLTSIEGFHTEKYFHPLFQLLPKSIMIQKRRKFKAYDARAR